MAKKRRKRPTRPPSKKKKKTTRKKKSRPPRKRTPKRRSKKQPTTPVPPHLALMALRHSPLALTGTIERPEFHLTSDLRATSDELWKLLSVFRRRLMLGGIFPPAVWQQIIFDIRVLSEQCQLLPSPAKWKWIVMTAEEAFEVGLSSDRESGEGIEMWFVCPGWGGLTFVTDVLKGFQVSEGGYSTRECAIEWAEGWMNAREQQLATPTPGGVGHGIDGLRPVPKPNGWTRGDLIGQAKMVSLGFGGRKFGRIRELAGIPAAKHGGGGAQRRFSNSQLRRLIDALRLGPFRYKHDIAKAWEELLPRN